MFFPCSLPSSLGFSDVQDAHLPQRMYYTHGNQRQVDAIVAEGYGNAASVEAAYA